MTISRYILLLGNLIKTKVTEKEPLIDLEGSGGEGGGRGDWDREHM